MSRLAKIVICMSFCVALTRPAYAGHLHCDQKAYSVSPPVTASGVYPVTGSPNSLFTLDFQVPAAPASSIPDCGYEISDLTFISITLTMSTTNAAGFGFNVFVGTPHPSGFVNTKKSFGVSNFAGTGTGTWIQTLNPHEFGDFEFTAPQTIRIAWESGGADTLIASGTGTISGSHYYTTPEPATALLVLSGLLMAMKPLFGRQRRNSEQARSPETLLRH